MQKEKNRIYSYFVHSIKNSISIIQNYAELIQDFVNEPLKFQKDIKTSAQKILKYNKKILDDIIDIDRYIFNRTDKLILHRERINLNRFILGFLKTCKYYFKISFDSACDPFIIGDKKLLNYILRTIIKNSIEASIHSPQIEIFLYQEEQKIFLSIKDNGRGIKKSDIRKIFDPFFKGEEKKNNPQNIGLGLTRAKEYCKKMKLSLIIKSELGKGTNVIIIFPIYSD